MTQKFTDPHSFLRNLVAKKGKSDLEGVYLTSVSVTAEAQTDYNYGISSPEVNRKVEQIFNQNSTAWNKLLVSTRRNPWDIVYPICFESHSLPVMTTFISDGVEMSCNVCIPTLTLDEFVTEVTVFQQLLREVAQFAGKTPTTLRFSIGVVTIFWDDMVEYGDAREVDVGF